MKKIFIVMVLFLTLLSSCLPPPPSANSGEVIYQYVPGQADALFAGTGAMNLSAAQRMDMSLVSYFSSQTSAAAGYGNLKFQSARELTAGTRELLFLAQQNNASNQIRSVWRTVDRGVNYIGVYATTTSTDAAVNLAAIENAAFAFLDRQFVRISSAR